MDSNVIRASAVSALRGIEPTPIHDEVAEWHGIDAWFWLDWQKVTHARVVDGTTQFRDESGSIWQRNEADTGFRCVVDIPAEVA